MGKRIYSASETLNNDLENDHYECARRYFRDRGTSPESVKACKDLFKDYDTIRDNIVEDMKKEGVVDDYYISDARSFNTVRAIEIIDIAIKDHQEQNYEPTESNQWRRA